jgi:hypothetical protein
VHLPPPHTRGSRRPPRAGLAAAALVATAPLLGLVPTATAADVPTTVPAGAGVGQL